MDTLLLEISQTVATIPGNGSALVQQRPRDWERISRLMRSGNSDTSPLVSPASLQLTLVLLR